MLAGMLNPAGIKMQSDASLQHVNVEWERKYEKCSRRRAFTYALPRHCPDRVGLLVASHDKALICTFSFVYT